MGLASKDIASKARAERLFLYLILFLFALLFVRLAQLQLFSHREYLSRAVKNKVQAIRISPPRGEILDRSGAPLALNKASFALKYFSYSSSGSAGSLGFGSQQSKGDSQEKQVLSRISALLNVNEEELSQKIERQRKVLYSYQPITLADELSLSQVAFVEENAEIFPGVFVESNSSIRYYPGAEATAHLVGFVGKPSQEELERLRKLGISANDLVGKEGVERSYEDTLRGVAGERLIEVDRNRRFRGELKLRPPTKGKDIYLTIDLEIQKKAYSLLRGRAGAIIVMRPKTGEVLALVSTPAFDPNKFRGKGASSYLSALLAKKDYPPMLNRAVAQAFSVGSVVKPAVMLEALRRGEISENTTFFCGGKLKIGDRDFRCWFRQGHGVIGLVDALGKSCDVAFYQIGLKLGPWAIKDGLSEFGFGKKSGIALPNEAVGLLPDPSWKRRHYSQKPYSEADRRWYDGDTANLAIGQGFMLATPLQVLLMINAIANDGYLVSPTILKGIREAEGVRAVEQGKAYLLPYSEHQLELVKRGLRRASLPEGTAENIPSALGVAGKTGTAELWKGEPHSWFAGYMPYDNPKVSFVVFLENGGPSHLGAVPIAKELASFLKGYLAK